MRKGLLGALAVMTGLSAASALAFVGCGEDDTVYARLGGEEGVRAAMQSLVVRVSADPKINGYFLNDTVDAGRLTDCLVKQVGEATGGPQKYDCRSMREAHAGLGISNQDWSDFLAHLVAVLAERGAAQGDVDFVVAQLGPSQDEIVSDPEGDGSVYHRVGRKPAIQAVVDAFVAQVLADAEINGFFVGLTDEGVARFKTCLVRQVASIDGPVKYGHEVDPPPGVEPGVSRENPCRSMESSHAGLTDAEGSGIRIADFNALLADLVVVLDAPDFDALVSDADKDAIVSALAPLCRQIVVEEDADACPLGPAPECSPEDDLDKDGYCPGEVPGTDCDDANASVRPDQTEYFIVARIGEPAATDFDYNCDGEEERQYPVLNCGEQPPATCGADKAEGFGTDPGCGVVGTFGTCQLTGGLCVLVPSGDATVAQGCR